MPRQLKTYQTSLGFFDLAVAAPSMKAAAEAWGSKTEEFSRGFAKQTDDPEIVAVTMAKPGVVLRRPVGSSEPFSEHAKLPRNLPDKIERGSAKLQRKKAVALPNKRDDKATRAAALAFEREQKHHNAVRRKQQAAREKAHRRREQAIAKAERALELATQNHDTKTKEIERLRVALEKRFQAESDRWEKQRRKLETALRRKRD